MSPEEIEIFKERLERLYTRDRINHFYNEVLDERTKEIQDATAVEGNIVLFFVLLLAASLFSFFITMNNDVDYDALLSTFGMVASFLIAGLFSKSIEERKVRMQLSAHEILTMVEERLESEGGGISDPQDVEKEIALERIHEAIGKITSAVRALEPNGDNTVMVITIDDELKKLAKEPEKIDLLKGDEDALEDLKIARSKLDDLDLIDEFMTRRFAKIFSE